MKVEHTEVFETIDSLSSWLAKHYDSEKELWIKIYKKHSGLKSVTWNDVVLEALCWGWIDGIKKSLDDSAYLQRISPRTKRSLWSKKNVDNAKQLIKTGKMQAPGYFQVQAAKSDGRWENAYVASQLEVPEDFLHALNASPNAQNFFNTLNKTSRYVIANGLKSAKKSETRERRFKNYMALLEQGKMPI